MYGYYLIKKHINCSTINKTDTEIVDDEKLFHVY